MRCFGLPSALALSLLAQQATAASSDYQFEVGDTATILANAPMPDATGTVVPLIDHAQFNTTLHAGPPPALLINLPADNGPKLSDGLAVLGEAETPAKPQPVMWLQVVQLGW